MSGNDGSRRRFMKACGGVLVAFAGTSPLAPALAGPSQAYSPVDLVDAAGTAVTCDDLAPGQEHIFHYPYASTPCFLIKLKGPATGPVALETESGERYEWRGGVGPDLSVVAFSAICAHRLTHPTREVSFIGYREDGGGKAAASRPLPSSGVIQCCSEQSIYDPANGARVLSGPAPQPLAAIDLRLDVDGHLQAHGAFGGTLFERFFDEFEFRLALEYGEGAVRSLVSDRTVVLPVNEYTGNRIHC